MDILKDLTIIIITNRHNYLKRILDYYDKCGARIIVADGSNEKFYHKDDYDIDYFHMPNSEIMSRINSLLDEIKTEFVLLNADDDFFLIDTMKKCVDFLQDNKDFVCAMGRVFYFTYYKKENDIKYYLPKHNYCIEANTIKDRVKLMRKNYLSNIYAIYRTDDLKKIIFGCLECGLKNPIMQEIIYYVITMIIGKTKEFEDTISHLCEAHSSSLYLNSEKIDKLLYNKDKEIIKYKRYIDTFCKKNNITMDKEIQYLKDNVLQNYAIYANNYKSIEQSKFEYKYSKCSDIQNIISLIKKYGIYSGCDYFPNKQAIDLSKSINKFYHKIFEIFNTIDNDKVAIYGAGVVGNIITALFNNRILCLFDRKLGNNNVKIYGKDVYRPEKIMEYIGTSPIIISVLGREKDIIDYLRNDLKIKNEILILF